MWIAGLVVCFGWILSLCMHEFAHAIVAYWGGDKTVKDKGYLTFNLFKYTQPGLSIILPLVFILMGGMGLPGGAVYINRSLLRNRIWHSLVSVAGVVANSLLALVLMIPFWLLHLRIIDWELLTTENIYQILFASLGYLIYIEVFAVIFNLLPIPGLDGYGIIEPWLPPQINKQLNKYGNYSYYFIFGLFFFVPKFNIFFFQRIRDICNFIGMPEFVVETGRYFFNRPVNQLIMIVVIITLGYCLRFSEHNWYQKGDKLARQQKDSEAIAAYDKAIKIKLDYADAWLAKGDSYFRLKDYQSAIKSYQKVIEIAPQAYNAWLFLANSYYGLENYTSAVDTYQQVIELNSNQSDGREYLYLADTYYHLEKEVKAIEVLSKGIKIYPENSQLWIYLASYLYNSQQFQEIIELGKIAPEIDSNNLRFYYFLGLALSKEKQYSEADRIFTQMIEIDPKNISALIGKAEIFYQQQHYSDAIALYQLVFQIEADNWTAWYNLACCYSLQKQSSAAISALQKAIALEPEKTLESIKQDQDFDYLRDTEKFRALGDGVTG